jgi:hypothetical protein
MDFLHHLVEEREQDFVPPFHLLQLLLEKMILLLMLILFLLEMKYDNLLLHLRLPLSS